MEGSRHGRLEVEPECALLEGRPLVVYVGLRLSLAFGFRALVSSVNGCLFLALCRRHLPMVSLALVKNCQAEAA